MVCCGCSKQTPGACYVYWGTGVFEWNMNGSSKSITISICLLLVALVSRTWAAKIPMTPDNWEFGEGKAEVIQLDGVQALRILAGPDQVVLKGLSFTNGTIEYDFKPDRLDFVGLCF